MRRTALRAFVGTLVAVAVVVGTLALWKLKVIVALLGAVALFLWLVVPRAPSQVEQALGVQGLPSSEELKTAARHSTGVKHDILVSLPHRLEDLPPAGKLVSPGLEVGLRAFEVLVGIFFVFASAAYWIVERDRAIELVCSLVPRERRKKVRDT